MTELSKQLEAEGFEHLDTGGNCEALFRLRDGKSDVITATDGISLPSLDDWMLCTYAGDWTKDAFGDQPVDWLDWDCSPVGLIEATRIVAGKASL